jgi:hypothetical protein
VAAFVLTTKGFSGVQNGAVLAKALPKMNRWVVGNRPPFIAAIRRHGTGEPQWLFPNEEGGPMDESRARKAFKRALKDAQLPTFRLYDLRHTYASLLLAAGAPITYVSAQLGHANPTTTLRYYARWIPGQGQRWVILLDRFGSKLGPKMEPRRRFVGVDDLQLLEKIGSPGRTRTCDLVINSHPLYRLSYRGVAR